jgi:hypothetical protein
MHILNHQFAILITFGRLQKFEQSHIEQRLSQLATYLHSQLQEKLNLDHCHYFLINKEISPDMIRFVGFGCSCLGFFLGFGI